MTNNFSSIRSAIQSASPLDLSYSASLSLFHDYPRLGEKILTTLQKQLKSHDKMLDVGAGRGSFTSIIKEGLGFAEAYGIDIRNDCLSALKDRKIITYNFNVLSGPLPFADGYFDFVMTMGLFHHLPYFDDLILEVKRVLKPGGVFLLCETNLSWWVDKLFLLTGFQPTSVEISKKVRVGLPWFYPRTKPLLYVHSATLKGMKELLKINEFEIVDVFGGRIPKQFLDIHLSNQKLQTKLMNMFIMSTDRFLSISPENCMRFFIISKKKEP